MKLKGLVCVLFFTVCLSLTVGAAQYRLDSEVIVEPQYESVRNFSNGFAAVKQNGKWGYIDETGDMIITPQFDYACDFSEGKAVVGSFVIDNEFLRFALVNSSGEYKELQIYDRNKDTNIPLDVPLTSCYNYEYIANEFIYDFSSPKEHEFFDGYMTVDCYGAFYPTYDKNGIQVLGNFDGSLTGFSDGLFKTFSPYHHIAFYDESGNQVLRYERTNSWLCYYGNEIFHFYDGYAGAWGRDDSFCIIDKKGSIVFKAYDCDMVYGRTNIVDSSLGYLDVVNDDIVVLRSKTYQKYGAMDLTGNIVIPFIYEELSAPFEGLLNAKFDGKFGFVDGKGNWVINPIYDDVTIMKNGIALALTNEDVSVIDRYGNIFEIPQNVSFDHYVSTDDYGVRSVFSPDNIITIKSGDKYGFARLIYDIAKPEIKEMSDWAYNEVISAIENDLIPKSLQNGYHNNITREEFALIIVEALEEIYGKDIGDILYSSTGITKNQAYGLCPFSDTANVAITICNKLGIINGVSETEFAPSMHITRQQAAAMLMRAATFVSGPQNVDASEFSDNPEIAEYAKQAVDYVTAKGIMNGVGNNMFAPNSPYTKEQAFMTVYRLFSNFR